MSVKEFCPSCGVVIKDGIDCMSWCSTRGEEAIPARGSFVPLGSFV